MKKDFSKETLSTETLLAREETQSNSYPMNPADNFTDVPRSSKYHSAVSWAYWMRVATGITPTTFEPESACTKAQVVTFIYNLEHSHFMDWLKMASEY